MPTLIKVRRGTDAERSTVIFDDGEPVYIQDTKRLYMGDGTTLGGILVGGSTYVDVKNSIVQDGTDDNKIMLDNDIPEGPSYANKVYATSDSGSKEWRDIADLAEPIGKKRSIEDDNGELQLVGDEDDPGENQLYGTDENGDRGWQDLKTIPITDFNWQNPDTIFEYNDDDDIIRVIFADGRYQTFDYTEDGNIEAEHYYDDSDNLLFSYEYTYDTNGNITLQDYVAG